ncbi:MAG: DNA polymerase III subunit gamma/tau [Pseudomonadota bacterium]|nr:DNA polymerase III subunit gamma/tau [Pseudomonadota bacterium]
MSYIVLARKLRPQTLQEVIGQPLVTKAIENALKTDSLHPVYLLTGTRGVGKTTIARIIAKSLNCENGPTPCLKCDTCKMIAAGSYPDLYEIDAASRTKVEDTRDILDQVQYMPQMGRKKVYLIDEVHMLSQHSFNALLKTLEEPPSHVQFILATTEPEKIPRTILSRCLHFNLQPLTQDAIYQHLANILKSDGVEFNEEALMQIADAGDGSMRDALSLLDQCLAISPKIVDLSVTQPLLSTIPKAEIVSLLTAVGQQDIATIQKMCDQFEENNIDFKQLLKQVSEQLILVAIDHTRGQENQLTKLWPATYVQVLYRMLMQGIADLVHSPSLKLGSLMCLIRMAVFHPMAPDTQTPEHSKTITAVPEPTLTSAKTAKVTTSNHRPTATASLVTQQDTSPKKPGTPENISADWSSLVNQLPLSPMLKKLAENCCLTQQSSQSWTLQLSQQQKHLLSDSASQKIQTAINSHLNTNIKLHIQLSNSESEVTPAMEKQAKKQSNNQAARESMQNDPVLNNLLAELNLTESDIEITSTE